MSSRTALLFVSIATTHVIHGPVKLVPVKEKGKVVPVLN
jgi:hypothetical protein